MNRNILIALFLIITYPCISQIYQSASQKALKDNWYVFKGEIKNREVLVSLLFHNDDSLEGDYNNAISNYEGQSLCSFKRTLYGNIKGDSVSLVEYDSNKVSGYLNGKIIIDTIAKFIGLWTDGGGGGRVAFRLVDNNIIPIESNYPYSMFGILGTQDQIENFTRKFKNSIIKGDKLWIANHIIYPAHISVGGKMTVIKTKSDFLQSASYLFNASYKEKVKKWCVHDIFANGHGANFEDVWFKNCENSTEKIFDFCIISF